MDTQTLWITETLRKWIEFSQKDFHQIPGTDLICYGMGYDSWGVQTQQKAFAAVAMLAVRNKDRNGIDRALRMLRFNLRSHKEGDMACLDGRKWGHTWISALGIERMMHAVYEIEPYMTDEDKALLRKVLISESDWLLTEYPVEAHPEYSTGKNKPESNAWNGALLFRTAKMYPDAPNAKAYLEKAELFFINTISICSDRGKPGVVDGNFFDSYGLNHHGYQNLGYMVVTLSQLAYVHFFCKEFGYEPPKNLYNHVEELWQLAKSCIAPDGRLLRIGGDSRFRYCYCQDYAIPTWLFIKDYLGDPDCDRFLNGWLDQVDREVKNNADGSFLSDRLSNLRKASQLYYTRLESDRAVVLTMLLAWQTAPDKDRQIKPLSVWQDDYHGSVFAAGEQAFRSFTWLGCDGPMGLCVPVNDSSMAEWEMNLTPEVMDNAVWHQWEVKNHTEKTFPGGFITCGAADAYGRIYVSESQTRDFVGTAQVAAAALPDGAGMLMLQRFSLPENTRKILCRVQGVNLKIPNDLYNGKSRVYAGETGTFRTESQGGENLRQLGAWANVDDKLGVYMPGGDLKLYSPGKRETGINPMYADRYTGIDVSHLYCDILVNEFSREYQDIFAFGDVAVIDNGFAVSAGTAAQTWSMATVQPVLNTPEGSCIRSVCAVGKDGVRYLLVANFGHNMAAVETEETLYFVSDGSVAPDKISLQPGTARFLRFE